MLFLVPSISLATCLAIGVFPGGQEQAFLESVEQERLLVTVRELVALGPRMGGTPSGDAAARYHAKRFRDAGLSPQLAIDPELRAFQTLSLKATVKAGDETLELVDGCLAMHSAGIEASEFELTFAGASGGSRAAPDGPALFVEEKELGDVLRARRKEPPKVVLVACERRVASSSAVLHQPPGFRGTLLSVSKREAQWVRERAAEDLDLAIAAEVFSGPGRPITVLADLPADSDDAPILLFCAHGDSDSGGPGADDNASGNAVVLELASAFAKLAGDAERPLELPFTLRFAQWGSEIHSSGAYFEKIKADGSAARHLAVINFDQAGTGAERDCVYFEPDDLPRNEPLVRLGLALGADYVGKEGCWTEYTSNAALGGTDSYVFSPGWRRGGAKEDLPAITIFSAAFGRAEEPAVTNGFRSPHFRAVKGGGERVRIDYSLVYHESGDKPEVTTELEPWNMTWVTKASGLLALRLADAPEAVKKLLDR